MTESLQSYSDCKASPLQWLGEIPTHWREQRAKYLYREVDERSISGNEELLSVSHITGVTPRSEKSVTMFMAESYAGHKLCRPGDLVVNTMWAWMAALGVARHTGLVSPSYAVYRPQHDDALLPEFADLLLRTQPYKSEYVCRSTGIRSSRLRLYPERFLEVPIVCPSMLEQRQIVAYLRSKDREIARLFRAKHRLIALLNEQKQAIIHRAVTRGLDPTVRLKPSGIAWLCDVPEHWEVVRYKSCVGFQEGPGIMGADFRDSGVPLLRISCLSGRDATLTGCNYLDPATVAVRWGHFAVQSTDYLLSASGSTGAVCRANEVVAGAIPYTGILRLWPRSTFVDMEYVRFFMMSRPFLDQIDTAKSGVAIEHFGPTHLKRMWMCLPPADEQRSISHWLTDQTATIEAQQSLIEREIRLVREYRTRLIADVVTGKLDVRGVALPDGDEEAGGLADLETPIAEDILDDAGDAEDEILDE